MYKRKLPGIVRFFLALISIALCFVLFATTIVTVLVADLRLLTSETGLQTVISEILFPTSAPAVRPGLAVGRPVIRYTEVDSGMQGMIVESLYEMLEQQFGGELPVSEEQVQQFLEDSSLPEYLSEKTADIVSDIISGETPTIDITAEEVEELLKENAPALKEHFDIEVDDEMLEQVGSILEDGTIMEEVEQQVQSAIGITPPATDTPGSDSPVDEGSDSIAVPDDDGSVGDAIIGSVEEFVGITKEHKELLYTVWNGGDIGMTEIPAALGLLRAVSSLNALLLCIGACLLVFLLMLLTHWGRPFAAVRTAGIPIMLGGGLMLGIGAIATMIPADGMDPTGAAAMAAIRSVLKLANYVSGGVAGLGLVMIILGAVLNSVFKKRAAARAAAAAAETIRVPAGAPEDTFSEQLMDTPAEEPEAEAEAATEEKTEE